MRSLLSAFVKIPRGAGPGGFLLLALGTSSVACGRRAVVEAPAEKSRELAPALEPTLERLGPGMFQGAEVCFNATDDNDNRLLDEGCEVRQGPVQFVIAWQVEDADVDLFVTDPEGQVSSPSTPTHLGLAMSGDCPTVDRACPSHHYENVYLDREEVPPGTYRVRVRLESSGQRGSLPDDPLEVRLGVRTPRETRGYLIAFTEVPQEVLLSFDIEPQPESEPPSDSEAREPGTRPDPG